MEIIIAFIIILLIVCIIDKIKHPTSQKRPRPKPVNQKLPSYMMIKKEQYTEPKIRYSPNLSYQKHFVVFDFETTGTDVNYCEIIEIGALKYEEGTIIDSFQTFVKPRFAIPKDASEVNYITNEMVKDAPSAEEVIPKFLDFIGDSKLMGYNIARFDLLILRRYSIALCGRSVDNSITDVYSMSRKKLVGLKRYRLSDVAKHFNIDVSNAHRAVDDCKITLDCFLKLQEIYRQDLEYRKAHKHED